MPKSILSAARYDFRGGRNSVVSPDLLNDNELVDMTNARLIASYGAFTKRSGSQRIHASAIGSGAAIRGLFQWDAPAGKQVVAIANGDLWYRTGFTYATAFTQVVSGLFSTTKPTFFQPFRANASGAPLILFIASDSKFFKWDGTTLTRIDTVAGTPDADRVIAYHTRL